MLLLCLAFPSIFSPISLHDKFYFMLFPVSITAICSHTLHELESEFLLKLCALDATLVKLPGDADAPCFKTQGQKIILNGHYLSTQFYVSGFLKPYLFSHAIWFVLFFFTSGCMLFLLEMICTLNLLGLWVLHVLICHFLQDDFFDVKTMG